VKVGRRPDYYGVIDEHGNVSLTLEHRLAEIEGAGVSVIRDAATAKNPMSDRPKHRLSLFIATMSMRMPRLHKEVEEQLGRLLKRDMNGADTVPEPDLRRRKAASIVAREGMGEDFVPVIAMAMDPAIPADRRLRCFAVQFMLHGASELAAAIAQMGWHLLKATPPHCFVTSDWPVSQWDPSTPESFFQAGLARPGVQLSMALTRECALFASWNGRGVSVGSANYDLVANINQRSVRLAESVYSSKPSFVGMEGISTRDGKPFGHAADE
jgi:hypothetical protein